MISKIFVFCLLHSLLIRAMQSEVIHFDREGKRVWLTTTTITTIPTTTVTTIPTTTKRPIPPMARAFVVCVKFKGMEGKILHNSDRKTAFVVTGYTETVSLCRKTVVFRSFLINSPNFYQLQNKCLVEYGQDFYTVEVILGKEEPKNLDVKFWTPIRIKSGGIFGRAHFKISNNGRDEMAAVDRSHWNVDRAFYRPPYCGIIELPPRDIMDTFGPSEGNTVPKAFESLNFDVGTLTCNSGKTKVESQRDRPKVYGYAEFYDYCNEAYSFCAFYMPEKAYEAFDGFCPKLSKFVGTTVVFKHKDRDYHCVLRQFSNVFYQTQLHDYEYKSYMHFNERFQEDAIYRNIECPLD